MTEKDVVCSLHFDSKFLLKFHEVRMPDGSIYRTARKRVDLSPTAYPTNFPKYPKYLIKLQNSRKPPRERNEVISVLPVETKVKSVELSHDDLDVHEVQVDSIAADSQVTGNDKVSE